MDVLDYLRSKGVPLKSAGVNNVHTACWYCQEDPSKRGRLYINVDPNMRPPGLFHCHLCGEQGAYNKIRKHFGDPALDDDGNEFGKDGSTNRDSGRRVDILNVAANHFFENLADHPEAYDWLRRERGLTLATIEKHKIGWAVGNTLLKALRDKGFSDDEIKDCGLFVKKGNGYQEFFQGKITIPYLVNGQCIQIRGKEIQGKYLTPPGDSTRLYNIDATNDAKNVIITEGEFDALILEQMGLNAVGCPGASAWQRTWNTYVEDVRRIYSCFDRDEAGDKGRKKLEELIGSRVRHIMMPEHDPLNEPKNDPSEWIVKKGHTEAEFRALLDAAGGSLLVTVDEAYAEWLQMEGNPNQKRLRLGFEKLDNIIGGGIQAGQVVVILARTGTGKALKWSEPVATPKGWRPIGDLIIGDQVIGSNGLPVTVTGVFPQGERRLFKVTFSDGATVTCDQEHLWTYTDKHGSVRTETLQKILERGLTYADGQRRVFVPIVSPVEYESRELPVDPYLLGVLLGDGCFRMSTPYISSCDLEILESVQTLVAEMGLKVTHSWAYDYRISGTSGVANPLKSKLVDLGLWGVKSEAKFIPDIYMKADASSRLALLQGLMDTDGSGNEFSSSSEWLAHQVAELVRSLGGVTGRTGVGVRRRPTSHLDHYRVTVNLPICPYRLTRKASTWKFKQPRRSMVEVVEVESGQAVCISVNSPDQLFVTKDYVVTHNTIFLINMFHRLLHKQPDKKILFLSLEQTRNEWFDRAYKIHRFFEPKVSKLDTLQYYRERLLIVDKNRVTEEDVRIVIEDFVEKMGSPPDLVAVDYLGYWARAYRGEGYERTTAAIMKMKEMAKDLKIPFVTPHQVNRGASNSRLDLTAARDSGAVEETADFLFGLNNIFKKVDDDRGGNEAVEKRTGELAMDVLKSRHGGAGQEIRLFNAPLSLALATAESGLPATWARDEWSCFVAGETPDDVHYRRLFGFRDVVPKAELPWRKDPTWLEKRGFR